MRIAGNAETGEQPYLQRVGLTEVMALAQADGSDDAHRVMSPVFVCA
jgi:hypothetical protein